MSTDYNPYIVLLSFVVGFLGSYIAICACEQLRLVYLRDSTPKPKHTIPWLITTGASLGGVGIWSMHFIGMSAIRLVDEEKVERHVQFNDAVTVFSLIVAVVMVIVGVYFGSKDRLFAKSKREILEIFADDFSKMSMSEIRHVRPSKLLFIACTKSLGNLFIGGLCAEVGVIVMHFVGMKSMEFEGEMSWNGGIVCGSVLIALFACVMTFWVLFRLLLMYPDSEWLRLVSV